MAFKIRDCETVPEEQEAPALTQILFKSKLINCVWLFTFGMA
jgi:uncharacterized protein involved in tolerance to divalent cations